MEITLYLSFAFKHNNFDANILVLHTGEGQTSKRNDFSKSGIYRTYLAFRVSNVKWPYAPLKSRKLHRRMPISIHLGSGTLGLD
jgi:hypothetical protein